jgi:hypothetical protein
MYGITSQRRPQHARGLVGLDRVGHQVARIGVDLDFDQTAAAQLARRWRAAWIASSALRAPDVLGISVTSSIASSGPAARRSGGRGQAPQRHVTICAPDAVRRAP